MQQAMALTGQAACVRGAPVICSARGGKQTVRPRVRALPTASRALT